MKNSGQWSVVCGQFLRAYCGAPLFFCCLFLALTLLSGCDKSGESVYKQGDKLWEEGKYSEALEKYREVASKDPQGRLAADALYQMGNVYSLNLKDYQKAVAAYRRLVSTSPKSPFSPDAQKKIAEIYRDKYGDLKGAISEYQRFVDLYPKEADRALFQMAQCHIIMRDFGKAREEFERILKDTPDIDYRDEVYYQIANSYYLEGTTDKARQGFEDLQKRFPDSKFATDARFGIALSYEETGDLQEALDRLIQLKGVYPNQSVLELRITGIKERIEARKRPMPTRASKVRKGHR